VLVFKQRVIILLLFSKIILTNDNEKTASFCMGHLFHHKNNSMPQKHNEQVAKQNDEAAKHHRTAAKHAGEGNHEKAAHHPQAAQGHQQKAKEHSGKAASKYAEKAGTMKSEDENEMEETSSNGRRSSKK
jgi:hypothetical protein